jgi:KDO2-lipid IV(A) lauroyltransferase
VLHIKKTLENYAAYFLFCSVKHIPLFSLYLISNCLAFFLHRIVRYRLIVISKNIDFLLPDIDKKEKKQIIKKFYRNITDTFLESLKIPSLNIEEINKRITIDRKLNDFLTNTDKEKQNIVVFASHFSNWEWLTLINLHTSKTCCSIYKPLHSKSANSLIKKIRKYYGCKMYTAEQLLPALKQKKYNTCLYAFIADQKPGEKQASSQIIFFNKKITGLKGPEIISKKLNCPIIYMHINRTKRGHYKISHTLISKKPRETSDSQISQQCFDELSNDIKQNPSDWLWSHNRFKEWI